MESPTYRTLVQAFTEFLTVAIHTILYERDIYPQTSFVSARKYNFAVRQNRHPKVCEWINDAVTSVETELLKGGVDRVAVVIYTKDLKPRERFMFDVSRFPAVPAAEIDTPLGRSGDDSPVLPTVDMEEQFRATMSRLANCSSSLKELPPACSFTVAIELKDEGKAPISHPQPWIPVQRQTAQDGEDSANQKTAVPLCAVAAGDMMFELWAEEAG
jgi:mitotic spindle assembly checkpoint protein MAD2B